jgi:hypothetical protein
MCLITMELITNATPNSRESRTSIAALFIAHLTHYNKEGVFGFDNIERATASDFGTIEFCNSSSDLVFRSGLGLVHWLIIFTILLNVAGLLI